MSDAIKHECGIALLRLKKPLSFYKEKYGSSYFGVQKMYLLMEKQHNRGQDGAGLASIKLDMLPGERYISRVRSNQSAPIQDIFYQINGRINEGLERHPELTNDLDAQKKALPYIGELFLGHVRYGTFGKNSIESVHPFLRQNNWMHRNLIVAGNFNLTNVRELFDDLIRLGQHPKEMADTVTVMEKIGHFLDDEVENIYFDLRDQEGLSKKEASPVIGERLDIARILRRASKNWDGGFAMAGLLGHGDAFVLRDPAGIRPAYYYEDDEVVVVCSERPVIQTAFNIPFESIKELDPGKAIIIKKSGAVSFEQILDPLERKACSFERIYFSRGNDAAIYQERKMLGRTLIPRILEEINEDVENAVFSYIPNTAEVSFFGMMEGAQEFLNKRKTARILEEENLTSEKINEILSTTIRTEKITIKDAKLRTFITDDSNRDDMVEHVYDVTYGLVKPTDTLIVIDDSIVRGTTLKKSIIKMLDRLDPKKIIIVSSAPQIRYPDCYGIDMAKLESLIAFNATLELLKERNLYHIVEDVYKKCKSQENLPDNEAENFVKEFYAPFTPEEISDKISEMLHPITVKADVKIIFQTIENLHISCPENLGDWYFTGDYPTPGGNRVVNRAFMNFYEGKNARAY